MWTQTQQDETWDVPGGPYYADVTSLVSIAADQLHHDELLKTNEFTLLEAMSAIEIMDARLDSGLAKSLEQVSPTPFSPFVALLPEELCWLIDRTFAAEMTWHQGRALSQTVHTILYVHQLQDLEPLQWYRHQEVAPSPNRSGTLMVQVLNSCIVGVLKCCDLAWREFSQRHLYENEDVMTEKYEVSLCESAQVARVVDSLESAEKWLLRQSDLPWSEDLALRLRLRKYLVLVFAQRPLSDTGTWAQFITLSVETLLQIRDRHPPPLPELSSMARAAIDPAVCRKLINHIPLPVINLFDQESTWSSLHDTLLGLADLCSLESTKDLVAWKTTLSLVSSHPPSFQRSAYVRSRTTSTFGNILVSDRHQGSWLLSECLSQIAGISPSLIENLHTQSDRLTLRAWHELETKAVELIHLYFKHLSNNRPRQRRQFSKNLRKWSELHDTTLALSGSLGPFPEHKASLERVSLVFLHLKLVQIVEILLSGFEMDLYLPDEAPFLYWLLMGLLSRQKDVLSILLKALKEQAESGKEAASDYLQSQVLYYDALQSMCHAAFMRLARTESIGREKISPNLRQLIHRRLEWAFPPEGPKHLHADLDVFSPSFDDFEAEIVTIRDTESAASLSAQKELWTNAVAALEELLSCGPQMTFSYVCRHAYQDFLESLVETCRNQISAPVGHSAHPSMLHVWFRI